MSGPSDTGAPAEMGERAKMGERESAEAAAPVSTRAGGMAAFRARLQQMTEGLAAFMRLRILPNFRDFLEDKSPFIWLLALIIGIAVAYAAIAFRHSIGAVQYLWLGTASERVSTAANALPWYMILAAPALGGLIVGLLLQKFMKGLRVHGVTDVIEAKAIRDCRIDLKTGLWSAVLSAISLGAGASAGREGPVVHLGATLASVLEDRFNLPHHARRTLLAAGVGAAVSASFNAPIAGVLFAHEVILTHFAQRAFIPIVISSVSATLVARFHLGNFPAFIIPEYQITSYAEFPAFALLGLTCAVVAISFQFAIILAERTAWSVRLPLWSRPVLGGLVIGTLALAWPQILGVGYEATDKALHQQYALSLLISLIVIKAIATAITLASRFGGGIFSPSLYLGAMTGAAYGLLAAAVFPEIASSEGLYAILGMGAVASAVLGAPFSTTLIVFELTGGYDMTIALLLTVSIANGLTFAVNGQSFFHWQLGTRGLFLSEGPHQEVMRKLRVADFMKPLAPGEDPGPLPPGDEDDERARLLETDTVEAALRIFDTAGHHSVPVVDPNDPTRIIGWAGHVAALDAFNRALIDAHIEGHR